MLFLLKYDAPDGEREYTVFPMTISVAMKQLDNFKKKYLNEDGTGKPYPNGKGFYPFTNPRLVPFGV